MKTIIYFLIFFILFFSSCVSQKNKELLSIEKKISKYYIEKRTEKGFNEPEKIITIYSIYHEIDSSKVKDGVYKCFNRLNSNFDFFIYENKKIDILELSNINDLTKSVQKLIQFSIKHGYCNDIINSYIKQMMSIYYKINNNRIRQDLNCEFAPVSMKSKFKYREIKPKLIQFLIENKQTINDNIFDDVNENLIYRKLDMYYGLPNEDEKLDIGIYLFLNSEKELKPNYIFISETDYEIMSVSENVYDLVERAILFGERNKLCYEKTNSIISDIIDFSNNTNCKKTFVIGNKNN